MKGQGAPGRSDERKLATDRRYAIPWMGRIAKRLPPDPVEIADRGFELILPNVPQSSDPMRFERSIIDMFLT